MAKSKPAPTLLDGQPIEPTWTERQRAFINSDARYPLMYGGVGAGKTAALCRRALRFSVCYPGNQGLLCRYTLGESNDTLLRTWRKFIPTPLYTMRADRWGWVITVATADRQHPSAILVRALDEEQKYQSLELGWFGISQANEQWITRDLWDTLTSRLRWTLPDGSHPPFTGFAEANSGSPRIIALWGPERDHAMTGYEAIEVSMYDNAANLPADYMQSLEEKPAWWKRWWLEACWEPLAELEGEPVFEGYFKHKLHVATDPLVPESGWPIVRGWDLPGRVGCIFFQVTRKGRILVLYEHPGGHRRFHRDDQASDPRGQRDLVPERQLPRPRRPRRVHESADGSTGARRSLAAGDSLAAWGNDTQYEVGGGAGGLEDPR
jgi:hypothetical protein